MKKYLYLVALLACSSSEKSESTKDTPKPGAAKPAEADPWLNANDKPAVKLPEDVQKLVDIAQNGPSQMQYPQADSVVALDQDDITLTDDGSVVEKHHSIVKILDAQRGKEKFADLHIPFDKKRQTLEIKTARTVTVAAEVHTASGDEISDIVPGYLSDATNYSDVRDRVVSFPAVDTGSVVELEWTRTTKATPDSSGGGEHLLSAWNPVLSRVVSITTPKSITPKLAITGSDVKAVETTAGNTHTYTITVEKIPDAHPEMGQPTDAAMLPRVVYGFKNDWAAVLAPVADRFLKIAVPSPIPASVVAKAHELVANAKTDEDKARALYAFVSRDIRTIDLPLGAAGYEPHTPDVVLENKYGDDRDKTGLLLALAAAEKLTGRPMMVRSGNVPVLAQVPTLAQFDHMIAKLDINGKDVWLSPSDEHGQYGLAFAGQDNLVLPVQRDGAELGKRELLDPSTSVSKLTATYTLAANGDLDAKYHYDLSGWFARKGSEFLRPLSGENLDKAFQSAAANVAGGAVDAGHVVPPDNKTPGPVAMDHHVIAPGYSAQQGEFRVFEIPGPSLDLIVDLPPSGVSERKYPLYVGTPRTHVFDVSVNVPAGWKVAFAPPKLSGTVSGIKYDDACTVSGQTVTCHSEYVVDKLMLDPKQYAEFHDAMTKLSAYERRVLLLTKA